MAGGKKQFMDKGGRGPGSIRDIDHEPGQGQTRDRTPAKSDAGQAGLLRQCQHGAHGRLCCVGEECQERIPGPGQSLELPQGRSVRRLVPRAPGRQQDGRQRRPVEIEPVKQGLGCGTGTNTGGPFAQDEHLAVMDKAAGHVQGRLLQKGRSFLEKDLAQAGACPAVCRYDVLRCLHGVVLMACGRTIFKTKQLP